MQHALPSAYPVLTRDYEGQEHTAAEVKKEVEMHLEEKEKLEATIPSNIIIGPFWVNTENTRQALSKKRKALSNAVLELLARQLRKQADDVSLGGAENVSGFSRTTLDRQLISCHQPDSSARL